MSADDSLSQKIIDSRAAVQAHMECSMPQRRAEWAAELKRRRLLPKPARKPPPELGSSPPTPGIEKSLLNASPGDVSEESNRSRKIKRFEEEGIESFWFGEQ
jgi:hypothetical protein